VIEGNYSLCSNPTDYRGRICYGRSLLSDGARASRHRRVKRTNSSCSLRCPRRSSLAKRSAFALEPNASVNSPLIKIILIAASQKLKWPRYSVLVVELHRARFVKHLKIRWIHEVTHFDIGDFERYFFHRVSALRTHTAHRLRTRALVLLLDRVLVRIGGRIIGLGPVVYMFDCWIHQHLDQFMRRRDTDQFVIVDDSFNKTL